jgi:hypothetical protein
MPISTSGIIGVALGDPNTTANFALGTVINLDDGGQAMYVQAASDISQFVAVSVRSDETVVPLTSTNAANSKRVAFAQTSIASAQFGWVQLGGVVRVNLLTACAPNVPLFTTATAGCLDDATVSGNGVGLVVGVTNAGSTASGTTALTCIAAYPHISGAAGAI